MGGMIAATVLGVFFIPLLFVTTRKIFKGKHGDTPKTDEPAPAAA
jgi:multidrug efflux pump